MKGFRLDIGLIFPLPLSSVGYLSYQAVGSILVNGGLNFASAWPMRHESWIPVFGGRSSVAFDTLVTALLLSSLTVVVGTWFVRRDVKQGVVRPLPRPRRDYPLLRWIPMSTVPRALLFAAVFSPWSVPLALGVLTWLGFDGMAFATFLPFKLTFAVVLGVLVTPLNAAVVLCTGASPGAIPRR
jgi:hypothetical protein